MNSRLANLLRACRLPFEIASIITHALNHRATVISIHDVAHGFVKGEWLYLNAGTWTKADRDAASSFADGMVSRVIGVDDFELVTHGRVTGLSGLTADNQYFLSSTPGAMQTTIPTSGYVQLLGVARSTTIFDVQIQHAKIPAAHVERLEVLEGGTLIATSHPAIIQSSAVAGDDSELVVVSGTSGTAIMGLGDTANELAGQVRYENTTDALELWSNATQRVVISSAGHVKILYDLDHDGANVGFYGATPVAQDTGWTLVSNLTTVKTYDANATSVEELADVLGTLIEQLKSIGLIST